jgi:hypothetical protein
LPVHVPVFEVHALLEALHKGLFSAAGDDEATEDADDDAS